MEKKNTKINLKSKRLWVLIISIAMIVTSTSYAFFTANITGTGTTSELTSALLRATYSEGTSTITGNSIMPGWSGEKTVTITSNQETTGAINYAIRWETLVSGFVQDTDTNSNKVCNLVYTVKKDNVQVTSGTLCSDDDNSDKQGDTIVTGTLAQAGDSDTYKITVEFVNQNYEQNDNKGKSFTLKLGAIDAVSISGTIYDKNGEPIANQAMVMYSSPTYFETDANGHYEVVVEQGNHDIYFIPDKTISELKAMGENVKTSAIIMPKQINTNNVNNITFADYESVVSITYDPNGGVLDNTTQIVSYGTSIENLPVPTKEGYEFVGWYTASTGGTKVTNSTVWTSSQTIYARYTQTEFNLSTYIKGLVGKDSTVVKDTTSDQNTRYVGKTVNNYVKFNNETWRIIGVFGNYTKIVKHSSIGSKKYNETLTYLDGDYYNGLNAAAKNMIQSYSWNKANAFGDEAAANVYNTEKNGKATYKVSLINLSDYMYAADNSCWTVSSDSYHKSCAGKDWLYISTTDTNINYFVLNRNASATRGPNLIGYNGSVTSGYDSYTYRIMPSVYLKNTVKIEVSATSNGTSTYPYKLSI